MMRGTETEFSTIIGDYKEVDGLMLPFSIETSFGESFIQTVTLTEVKLNLEISPDRFKMPEAKEAEKETSGSD
jgi:outer membrane lipoprotein-sorting protein